MAKIKLLVWFLLLLQQQCSMPFAFANAAPSAPSVRGQSSSLSGPGNANGNANDDRKDSPSASSVLGSMYRKSRQSRCVRCYEDRYQDDRSRGYGGGGGYAGAGRTGDDRSSSWYYSGAGAGGYDRYNDRYDDRYRGGEYDRYYSPYYRDRESMDRYGSQAPRGGGAGGYDRYEGRGYDRYYDERRPSGGYGYDRGESRGYGYDNRDRYYGGGGGGGVGGSAGDRYGDNYRDRGYYEKGGASGGYGGYDRDYYDRYYSRYDFRNYRPWDETYRGQSGFDNSGRGYYFANDEYGRKPSPCGWHVIDCPHAQGDTSRVSSRPIESGAGVANSSGSNAINRSPDVNSNRGANSNSNNNKSNNNSNSNIRDSDRERERERERERNQQQSPAYGGRPPRPLSGSYLFDRDSNVIAEGQTASSGGSDKPNDGQNVSGGEQNQSGSAAGGGGDGGGGAPTYSAQTRNQEQERTK